MKTIIVFFFLIACSFAGAEIYAGIEPYDTLANIKTKLPSAVYDVLSPAWAKEYDAIVKITGAGISGAIVAKFTDTSYWFRKNTNNGQTNMDSEYGKIAARYMQKTEDESLEIEWVRWVPDENIPLDRVIKKYGKPKARKFSEDMREQITWAAGVEATLDKSGKNVILLDYSFTNEERKKAFFKKGLGDMAAWNMLQKLNKQAK